MERAVLCSNNGYSIPNMMVYGYVCKTNIASNTAFRGFGGPQAMLIAESMMRQIADHLHIDPFEVRIVIYVKIML